MSDMITAICTWPNGEKREVVVTSDDGEYAMILWNERVESKHKAVTGFDDKVPLGWLDYGSNTEETTPS